MSGHAVPEQGQVVRLRHKAWAVTSVSLAGRGTPGPVHRVSLECLSDDALGHEIQVIWEREIAPAALESTSLPVPMGTDDPATLQAFLRALRWSSASLAEGDVLQAPFRGGVQIEEYQLAPVLRAARMPRVRLLIADDVGLGKTIEAGLIAQELIHSHRASGILVLCPAHLKQKWVDEMAEKFGLEFRIIERSTVVQMRKEFGPTINPWASFPRLVTSIDYLKTEHPLRLFEELARVRGEEQAGTKPWDLLILDEAHNVAPAGRKKYVRDSDRTSMMRAISGHFEHKVFLTATPHNGYRESFTGLLELLDDLRFSRGTELDKPQLSAVTVRRLKREIKNADGTDRFPNRLILPRSEAQDPGLYVDLSESERTVFELLERYTASRLANVERRAERPLQFVLTLLKKRALSSPLALRESLVTHTETVGVREELDIGDSLFRSLEQRESEDWSDDDEKEELTEAVTAAASRLCAELTDDEKGWLASMAELVEEYANLHTVRPDAKARALLRWIEDHLRSGKQWNGERVIVFTEYKHTLSYLERVLEDAGYGDAVMCIVGGMPDKDRQAINEAFQSADELTPVRILLATDAASEGADFQKHCRNLIHYEIPWNPVRLEQRNGRVDRHGQRATEVRVHHFVFRNHEDSEFLQRIVEKVETIRADLGSVGALIADNVRKRALGTRISIDDVDRELRAHKRRGVARAELSVTPEPTDDIEAMVKLLHEARTSLGISEEAQLDVLERALDLEGEAHAIERREDGQFLLLAVPGTWTECRKYVTRGELAKPLTFDRDLARDNDNVTVVHLDHPLMRRATAGFRVRMWSDGRDGGLHRVAVQQTNQVTVPHVRCWGRLVLLGPERNRLHEGLVRCDARLNGESVEPAVLPESITGSSPPDFVPSPLLKPAVAALNELLRNAGQERAKALQGVLKARGDAAEKHARGLATERMAAIRKTIKKWEKEEANNQLRLFDIEERDQRSLDLAALRARLVALAQERETEPKRQRRLYRVADRRVYPVAIELYMPTTGA